MIQIELKNGELTVNIDFNNDIRSKRDLINLLLVAKEEIEKIH